MLSGEHYIPEEAPNDMLQEPDGLLIDQLGHHVAQHSSNRIESLVCLANVLQAHVVKQDFLDNENRNCLAELRAGLHDTKAKWNDLGGEEEVDDLC